MIRTTTNPSLLPAFLQSRLAAVEALCRKHSVKVLYAVGSVLRPADFGPASDVDLLFAFDEDAISDEAYNTNLWTFWQALEQLMGRKVDLIHGPSLKNPYLIEELLATRMLLVGSESGGVFA